MNATGKQHQQRLSQQFRVRIGAAALGMLSMAAPIAPAAGATGGDADSRRTVLQIGSKLVSQASADCVGGYRTTHIVVSQGRANPGVILRCRG